ncbi:MAG: hypothetical protein B6D34_00585 [Candidatus Brocadia sp. UTAMX1]|nr:MAG: hypothetical protein B6D34_00585 [Candidatus Brocadia sp. UTAMX1]
MFHSCCRNNAPVIVYYPYFGYVGYKPYFTPSCCPACSMPYNLCTCSNETLMMIPEDLAVDTAISTRDTFVGGIEDVNLTLEYMSDGGTPGTRTVTITITSGGGTTVWKETNIADGYHVKDDFASIQPGANVKIEVADCKARLRWCETICC